MVFEDGFVYPFPHTMYDPVLKVRVQITSYHETYLGDVPFVIYYDPEIEADRLTLPMHEETKAFWRSRPQDAHKADDDSIRRPFKSDNEVKVDDQPCYWASVGDAVRLKIKTKVETCLQTKRIIKALNIAIISDDPLSFLIYVYKNYINLSELEDEYYTKEICPDAKRVEMCLNADAFLNAFNLSPDDYAEVEPGWYCLASKELVR